MGHVVVNSGAVTGVEVPITDEAARVVRMSFNPSDLPDVDIVKALSAALLAKCEEKVDKGGVGTREAAIASAKIQAACMFAVAAFTAHLSH